MLEVNVWIQRTLDSAELLERDAPFWMLAWHAITNDCVRFVPDRSLGGGYYAHQDGTCVFATSALCDNQL